MYTRIALGKNSAMDVVSGESSGGQGQLLILYPLLFALQLLEIWIGEKCIIDQFPFWCWLYELSDGYSSLHTAFIIVGFVR